MAKWIKDYNTPALIKLHNKAVGKFWRLSHWCLDHEGHSWTDMYKRKVRLKSEWFVALRVSKEELEKRGVSLG